MLVDLFYLSFIIYICFCFYRFVTLNLYYKYIFVYIGLYINIYIFVYIYKYVCLCNLEYHG